MTDSDPPSDPLQSATKEHAKCEKCGATMRLDTGICVSCLLREGLEGGDDVSQAFLSKRPRRGGRAATSPGSWEITKFSNRSVAAAWA